MEHALHGDVDDPTRRGTFRGVWTVEK